MNIYLGAFIAIMLLVHITCLFALKMKRNDLADVIWGPGFVVAAIGAILAKLSDNPETNLGVQTKIVLFCVTAWALRLFFHIGIRNLKKPKEDARYLQWRTEWGKTWVWRSYLQVFVLQAIILLIIDLPLLKSIEIAPQELSGLGIIGLLIWFSGFLFESIGDSQLKKFTSDPANKGKIMDQGLWSWSRHPNYFGEVAQWWGVFLMVVQLESWWLIVSPLTITFLILKVSGVPMLEKLMDSRPGFQEYKKRTSIFFPLPPKRAANG